MAASGRVAARDLALLIHQAAPRLDSEAIAGRLLSRHGSLGPILESQPQDLMRSEPLSLSCAQLVTMVPQLSRYLRIAEVSRMKSIRRMSDAGRYLCAQYIGIHYERVYLLCLARDGRLIANVLVQQGTVDEAPFYLRNLIEAATRANAEAVVLSHNHPSGTPHPSRADIDSTKRALGAFSRMGMVLLDHIIVADGVPISLHQDSLVPRQLFIAQDKDSDLLQNWLK